MEGTGEEKIGWERPYRIGMERTGLEWSGEAWQEWNGVDRIGGKRNGKERQERLTLFPLDTLPAFC